MAGLFQSQKALYRLAGRRLRYEVYFAIGLIWMAALLYGAIVNLALQQPVGSGVKTLLVLTALLYGGQLAAFRPWIALACTVVGGIAGLLAYLVNAFTGFYADEIFIGTTVGAARYMFRAHQWTIELAIRASVSNEQHLVAQA